MKVHEDEQALLPRLHHARQRGDRRGRYDRYHVDAAPGIWFMTQAKNSQRLPGEERQGRSSPRCWTTTASTRMEARRRVGYTRSSTTACSTTKPTSTSCSRLLEEVGIYYFFEHEETSHTMVLHRLDGQARGATRSKRPDQVGRRDELRADHHRTGTCRRRCAPPRRVLTDYDYLAPKTKIEGEPARPRSRPRCSARSEWFEHPARVVQNGVKPEKPVGRDAVKQRATVRMEELLALYASATGTTNMRDLGIGMTFDARGRAVRGRQRHLPDGERASTGSISADHEAIDDLKTGAATRRLLLRLPVRQARRRRTTARRASRRGRCICRAADRASSSAPAATRSKRTSTAASRSSSTGTAWARRTRTARAGCASPSRGRARATACSACRGSATRSSCTSSTAIRTGRWSSARSTTTTTCWPGSCPSRPRSPASRAATSKGGDEDDGQRAALRRQEGQRVHLVPRRERLPSPGRARRVRLGRQQRIGQGHADAQGGDRRELVRGRHQGRDAQHRQGPARQRRRRHLLHRRSDLPARSSAKDFNVEGAAATCSSRSHRARSR